MGSNNPTSGSTPSLQTGERVSGPLPELPTTPLVTTSPAPQPASTSIPLHQRAGNILSTCGALLTLVGLTMPTYLAELPLNRSQPSLDNVSITGTQILFFQRFVDPLLWSLVVIVLAAVINIFGLASARIHKLLVNIGKLLRIGAVILICSISSLAIYVIPLVFAALWSLNFTLKATGSRLSWLRVLWPVIGIGALLGSTGHFFSTTLDNLLQVTGSLAHNYHYDYFASLGPGAWLSLAGLLTALLGGVLAFQATKQHTTATP